MRSNIKILLSVILAGIVLIVALYLYMLINYETRISITGGEKPTFHLSGGSGSLSDFVITGPRQRSGNGRDSFVVWELRPMETSSGAEPVRLNGDIEYGSIPKGCKQVYPENGVAPPPIQPGEFYGLQLFTSDAPWVQLAFELRDGKAIERPIK